MSELWKPSWLPCLRGQRVYGPVSPGVKSSSVLAEARNLASQGSAPGALPHFAPSSSPPFSVARCQCLVLLMAEDSFASNNKRPWANLSKNVLGIAKELWSSISLKWKGTYSKSLHNTLCSVGALISFGWLEAEWDARPAKSIQLFGWECPQMIVQLPLRSLSNTSFLSFTNYMLLLNNSRCQPPTFLPETKFIRDMQMEPKKELVQASEINHSQSWE